MRQFISGFAACYAATAIIFGLGSVGMGPPAMNIAGHVYYAVVWPAWPISAGLHHLVVPIPNWAFTFKSEQR
jgi:hypothetical protein